MLFTYTCHFAVLNLHTGGDGRYISRIQWTSTHISSDTGKYLPTKGRYLKNRYVYKWAILGILDWNFIYLCALFALGIKIFQILLKRVAKMELLRYLYSGKKKKGLEEKDTIF